MIGTATAAAARWIVDAFPHIPSDTTAALQSSILSAWFVHPERQVVEFVIVNAALIAVLAAVRKLPWKVAVPAVPHKLSPIDFVLAAACVIVCAGVVYCKVMTGRLIYLLQPCHVTMAILTALTLKTSRPPLPGGPDAPSFLFNAYIHWMCGAWAAVAAPDTRDQTMIAEGVFFWSEHALLCLLPLYYLYTRRFTLYEPRIVHMWDLFILYHANVLLPASLLSGNNLNYVMVPPAGFLRNLGQHYRVGLIVVVMVLIILVRLIIAGGWIFLLTFLDKVLFARKSRGKSE